MFSQGASLLAPGHYRHKHQDCDRLIHWSFPVQEATPFKQREFSMHRIYVAAISFKVFWHTSGEDVREHTWFHTGDQGFPHTGVCTAGGPATEGTTSFEIYGRLPGASCMNHAAWHHPFLSIGNTFQYLPPPSSLLPHTSYFSIIYLSLFERR